jgi:putative hydrolase of HD superfamily
MQLENYIDNYRTLKNIKRFSMESIHSIQDLCGHGYGVANIFYLLCKELHIKITEEDLFMALNHDFAEAYTGDLNRLVKDKNERTQKAWSIIENEILPKELENWTMENICKKLGSEKAEVLKIADELDAFLFCTEEVNKGNTYMERPKNYYQWKLMDRIRHGLHPTLVESIRQITLGGVTNG